LELANILTIESLNKHFDGIKAVQDFCLALEEGQIICLIGPNGAGKTTLFNLICGFIRPDSGGISFNGQRILGISPYRIANLGITRSFQNLRLIYQISVLDNILLAFRDQKGESIWHTLGGPSDGERRNREKARSLLKFLDLGDKADDLAENLSYGQQKMLTLAICLAGDGDLFLFDEPIAGLHPDKIAKIFEVFAGLKTQGKTIFFIEHHLEAAMKVSDVVVVMDEGRKITAAPPQIIREDPQVLKAYLT
jgi:ABC-type branched-subunit amino acid transport system ATPase component